MIQAIDVLIAKIVLGYLNSQKLSQTATSFLNESLALQRGHENNEKLIHQLEDWPNLLPSLEDILHDYFAYNEEKEGKGDKFYLLWKQLDIILSQLKSLTLGSKKKNLLSQRRRRDNGFSNQQPPQRVDTQQLLTRLNKKTQPPSEEFSTVFQKSPAKADRRKKHLPKRHIQTTLDELIKLPEVLGGETDPTVQQVNSIPDNLWQTAEKLADNINQIVAGSSQEVYTHEKEFNYEQISKHITDEYDFSSLFAFMKDISPPISLDHSDVKITNESESQPNNFTLNKDDVNTESVANSLTNNFIASNNEIPQENNLTDNFHSENNVNSTINNLTDPLNASNEPVVNNAITTTASVTDTNVNISSKASVMVQQSNVLTSSSCTALDAKQFSASQSKLEQWNQTTATSEAAQRNKASKSHVTCRLPALLKQKRKPNKSKHKNNQQTSTLPQELQKEGMLTNMSEKVITQDKTLSKNAHTFIYAGQPNHSLMHNQLTSTPTNIVKTTPTHVRNLENELTLNVCQTSTDMLVALTAASSALFVSPNNNMLATSAASSTSIINSPINMPVASNALSTALITPSNNNMPIAPCVATSSALSNSLNNIISTAPTVDLNALLTSSCLNTSTNTLTPSTAAPVLDLSALLTSPTLPTSQINILLQVASSSVSVVNESSVLTTPSKMFTQNPSALVNPNNYFFSSNHTIDDSVAIAGDALILLANSPAKKPTDGAIEHTVLPGYSPLHFHLSAPHQRSQLSAADQHLQSSTFDQLALGRKTTESKRPSRKARSKVVPRPYDFAAASKESVPPYFFENSLAQNHAKASSNVTTAKLNGIETFVSLLPVDKLSNSLHVPSASESTNKNISPDKSELKTSNKKKRKKSRKKLSKFKKRASTEDQQADTSPRVVLEDIGSESTQDSPEAIVASEKAAVDEKVSESLKTGDTVNANNDTPVPSEVNSSPPKESFAIRLQRLRTKRAKHKLENSKTKDSFIDKKDSTVDQNKTFETTNKPPIKELLQSPEVKKSIENSPDKKVTIEPFQSTPNVNTSTLTNSNKSLSEDSEKHQPIARNEHFIEVSALNDTASPLSIQTNVMTPVHQPKLHSPDGTQMLRIHGNTISPLHPSSGAMHRFSTISPVIPYPSTRILRSKHVDQPLAKDAQNLSVVHENESLDQNLVENNENMDVSTTLLAMNNMVESPNPQVIEECDTANAVDTNSDIGTPKDNALSNDSHQISSPQTKKTPIKNKKDADVKSMKVRFNFKSPMKKVSQGRTKVPAVTAKKEKTKTEKEKKKNKRVKEDNKDLTQRTMDMEKERLKSNALLKQKEALYNCAQKSDKNKSKLIKIQKSPPVEVAKSAIDTNIQNILTESQSKLDIVVEKELNAESNNDPLLFEIHPFSTPTKLVKMSSRTITTSCSPLSSMQHLLVTPTKRDDQALHRSFQEKLDKTPSTNFSLRSADSSLSDVHSKSNSVHEMSLNESKPMEETSVTRNERTPSKGDLRLSFRQRFPHTTSPPSKLLLNKRSEYIPFKKMCEDLNTEEESSQTSEASTSLNEISDSTHTNDEFLANQSGKVANIEDQEMPVGFDINISKQLFEITHDSMDVHPKDESSKIETTTQEQLNVDTNSCRVESIMPTKCASKFHSTTKSNEELASTVTDINPREQYNPTESNSRTMQQELNKDSTNIITKSVVDSCCSTVVAEKEVDVKATKTENVTRKVVAENTTVAENSKRVTETEMKTKKELANEDLIERMNRNELTELTERINAENEQASKENQQWNESKENESKKSLKRSHSEVQEEETAKNNSEGKQKKKKKKRKHKEVSGVEALASLDLQAFLSKIKYDT